MTFEIRTLPPPIRIDEHGYARMVGSRIGIDTVIWEFNHGQTPEQIVTNFPTLNLADVYGVIAYYLREKENVDQYLEELYRKADEIRREIEQKFPSEGLKEKLEARLREREQT